MTQSGASRRIKKFYSTVDIAEGGAGFSILLDGREAKTPARAALGAPNRTLAEALAEEWRGDGETVDFDAMMLTRLASTAIDLAERDRDQWTDEVLKFLASDLVCYRADEPAALMERQSAVWSPYDVDAMPCAPEHFVFGRFPPKKCPARDGQAKSTAPQ